MDLWFLSVLVYKGRPLRQLGDGTRSNTEIGLILETTSNGQSKGEVNWYRSIVLRVLVQETMSPMEASNIFDCDVPRFSSAQGQKSLFDIFSLLLSLFEIF
ncbi:Uncharacterised protein at_DN1726 [Pycnogonum litorale]